MADTRFISSLCTTSGWTKAEISLNYVQNKAKALYITVESYWFDKLFSISAQTTPSSKSIWKWQLLFLLKAQVRNILCVYFKKGSYCWWKTDVLRRILFVIIRI
jgi:hypothetical protein